MEINIEQLNSTVRATDSQALLSEALLERIVEAVRIRLEREAAREERAANERRLRPANSARETSSWE